MNVSPEQRWQLSGLLYVNMPVTRNRLRYDAAPAAGQRSVSVVVPPEHQGVVNALRSAYPADRAVVPTDLARLLDRLR